MYHSAVEAQGGSLYITTLVYIAVALVAGTLIVLAAKALGARKRRKDEEARQKASWQTKVASDLEVKEAAKRDEARVSAVKSADHLSKDCDCGLYKKLWGFVEGGPIQWEVHQGESEILGVLVRVEEPREGVWRSRILLPRDPGGNALRRRRSPLLEGSRG